MREIDVIHGVVAIFGAAVLLAIAVGDLHTGTEFPVVTKLMLTGFGLLSLGIAAEFLQRGFA